MRYFFSNSNNFTGFIVVIDSFNFFKLLIFLYFLPYLFHAIVHGTWVDCNLSGTARWIPEFGRKTLITQNAQNVSRNAEKYVVLSEKKTWRVITKHSTLTHHGVIVTNNTREQHNPTALATPKWFIDSNWSHLYSFALVHVVCAMVLLPQPLVFLLFV